MSVCNYLYQTMQQAPHRTTKNTEMMPLQSVLRLRNLQPVFINHSILIHDFRALILIRNLPYKYKSNGSKSFGSMSEIFESVFRIKSEQQNFFLNYQKYQDQYL